MAGRCERDGSSSETSLVSGLKETAVIGEGLKGHLRRAQFRNANACRAGFFGKKRHRSNGLLFGSIKETWLDVALGSARAALRVIGLMAMPTIEGEMGVGQKWSSRTGDTAGGASGGIVFIGLEILKVSGIENLADGKRSVEIGFVRASCGQTADEHGARLPGLRL